MIQNSNVRKIPKADIGFGLIEGLNLGWKAAVATSILGEMGTGSIVRPLICLLLALAIMGCGDAASTKPIKVDEFLNQIDRLNGQTVSVTGYISDCQAYSCGLYRNKAESDEVDRAMSVMRAALEEGGTDLRGFPFPNHPSVSIGTGSRFSFFDLRASFYANSYVVITGKASSECLSEGRRVCFDRADDLDPIAIRSASAPSNE